ncbi:hypothetical protein E2C01_008302 [Portunus trituberculatus]|uniref:Uncharacterized protein n=1 Tax=Portunus trituberculatus TaxID=210409 RepID=A0A5B7D1I0_PORTR|nr:hypothetical protein [Portunus trituberculatus]
MVLMVLRIYFSKPEQEKTLQTEDSYLRTKDRQCWEKGVLIAISWQSPMGSQINPSHPENTTDCFTTTPGPTSQESSTAQSRTLYYQHSRNTQHSIRDKQWTDREGIRTDKEAEEM